MTGTLTSASPAHDSCVRCGRPTPLGVALCEADNPGRIKGPSATQVHGTIVAGIVGGFVLFALLARLVSAGGPFESSVVGSARQADGSTAVVIAVTNTGSSESAASCRISQGGVVGSGDDVFFSGPIAAGATREFARSVPAIDVPTAGGRDPVIAVRCN